MGRLDANTTQYNQGLHELPEIINDAPPPQPFHEENHGPSSEYQKSVKPNKNIDHESRSALPSEAYPPPQNQPHSFPPPPPPSQDHENMTQAFPPPYEETKPQSFPQPEPNAGHHFQQQPNVGMQFQQPNVGMQFQQPNVGMQFQQQQQQPNVGMQFHQQHQQGFHHQTPTGGVQMGHPVGVNMAPSPLPFIPGGVQNQLPNQPWKSDLFDCMKDPQNAIITTFFPCVTFGQIAEVVDSGNSSCATNGIMYWGIAFCIGMPCILSCTYRTKLRSKFGIIESPAPDWLVHFLCEPCALCQEYRELKDRNLDPSIGWVGNVAKQQQMAHFATAPPMQQRMM